MDEPNATERGENQPGEETETSTTGPGDTDAILQFFVVMADTTGMNTGVTLNVGGLIISGTLVGMKEYFDSLVAGLRTARGNAMINEVLGERFNKFAEKASEIMTAPYKDLWKEPEYIHLKNARWYTPGGAIPTKGILWRGRLGAVDGFSLGIFE
jgi:hypothetical protein